MKTFTHNIRSLALTLSSLALLAGQTALGGYWITRGEGQYWQSIAASADGTKLVAAKVYGLFEGVKLYTSLDGGDSWTERHTIVKYGGFPRVASSSNGNKLVAVVSGDFIYTSVDSGANWVARDSARGWSCVASSDDGTKLVAGVANGYLYTSTDSGSTWTQRASSRAWEDVTSSSGGTKLLAVETGGNAYTSTDSGVTWTTRYPGGSDGYRCVASSADGTQLLVGGGSAFTLGDLYVSSDSGAHWNARNFDGAWASVAISSVTSRKLAATYGGPIYDLAGNTPVTPTGIPTAAKYWGDIAVSADGSRVFGTEAQWWSGEFHGNGRIWAYFDDGTTGVKVEATDAQAGEPNTGKGNGTFTFTRMGSTASDLTVHFTVGGTATSGSDYTALGTTVTILAGSDTAIKTVSVIDDALLEGITDETVVLTLASGTGYRLAYPSSATVTIRDDETAWVTVAATDATAGESGTGQGGGTFTFTRTGSTTSALDVNFTLNGSTATSGSDYTPLVSPVHFNAGQTAATRAVDVINDTYVEGDETVVLTLTSGTGYGVDTPSEATVTIKDDEPPGAQYKHWQGDVSSNWNVAGNWYENAVPVNGDHLFFEAGATRYVTINNMTGLALDGITFTDDGGYVVQGNGVTLTSGLTSAAPAGENNELDIDLTLGASQTFRCDGGILYPWGHIDLGAYTLTVTTADGTWVNIGGPAASGLVSGTGGVTKDGPGTLEFGSWSTANTYTGPTNVKDGILLLNRVGGHPIAGPGTLTIGDAVGNAGSAVVRYDSYDDQIGSVPIVVNTDGLLDLAGRSETIGNGISLTLNGGDITLGTGTLTLGLGTVTVTSSSSVINGPSGAVSFSGTRTFDIDSGVFFDLQAPTAGSGGLNKAGAGKMRLGHPGTYAGLTTVQAGILDAWTAQSLGGTAQGTRVNSGATLLEYGDMTVTDEPLFLNGTGAPGLGALQVDYFGVNSWTGPVTLESVTEIVVSDGSATYKLPGVIFGAGGFIKTGPGTLVLEGATANTYSGNTVVNEGVLGLNKSGLAEAVSAGSLIIGDGVGGDRADVVKELAANQISTAVAITINGSGLLDLNGYNDTAGTSLTMNGNAAIETAAGTLTLGANATVTATPADASINGNLNVGSSGSTCTFDISTGWFSLNAVVGGAANIVKNGAGRLFFNAANTFNGSLTANAGILGVTDSQALGANGSSASGTIVNDPAKLQIWDTVSVGNEYLTLNTASPNVAMFNSSQNNSWAGPITLNGSQMMEVGSGSELNLSGAIGGTGSITKVGAGTLRFSGTAANTYGDTTYVNAGTLVLQKSSSVKAVPGNLVIGDGSGSDIVRLESSNQIASAADVFIQSGGLLECGAYYAYLNTLHGPGTVNFGSDGWLNIGGNNGTSTFDGTMTGVGLASGYTLGKSGSGTLTMNGSGTYSSGIARVFSPGKLVVNGSLGSAVTVDSGASLGGTGTIGGNTTVANNGKLAFNLSTAAASHDKLDISGTKTLTLSGASVLDITASGTPGTGIYTLITAGGGITGVVPATVNLPPDWAATVSKSGDNKSLLLDVSFAASYDAWASAMGLDGSAGKEKGPGDDPDKDGRSNLDEYAFDGNPLSGATEGKLVGKVATLLSNGNKVLTLTLPVRRGASFSGTTEKVSALIDGIIYTIQGSDTLAAAAWTLAVTEITGTDAAAIQAGLPGLSDLNGDLTTEWTYRTFRTPGTVTDGDPRDFLRAKVTK